MKSLCCYAIYLERVRDLDAADAEAADFGFFFSKLNLAAANNTADISGARLMTSPPFVFGGGDLDFGFITTGSVSERMGFAFGDDLDFFSNFSNFTGISIIIRIN
jgi:hypothetical protein